MSFAKETYKLLSFAKETYNFICVTQNLLHVCSSEFQEVWGGFDY